MDIHEKELALNQILKEIEMLESFIEETTSTYYLPKTIRVNGIQLEISTFDLIQTIKSDYKNIVLKEIKKANYLSELIFNYLYKLENKTMSKTIYRITEINEILTNLEIILEMELGIDEDSLERGKINEQL